MDWVDDLLIVFLFIVIGVFFSISLFNSGFSPGIFLLMLLSLGVFSYKAGSRRAFKKLDNVEKVEESESPTVHKIVEEKSEEYGIPKPEIYLSSMGSCNALAIGRAGNGKLVLSYMMVKALEDDELIGVICHELSHFYSRDSIFIFTISGIDGLFKEIERALMAKTDVLDFIAIGVIILRYPISLFEYKVSRWREYRADADAAEHTSPESMSRALIKCAKVNSGKGVENKNSSEFFFHVPTDVHSFIRGLTKTHPPIKKRIENINDR